MLNNNKHIGIMVVQTWNVRKKNVLFGLSNIELAVKKINRIVLVH